jgi:HEAT repeat protein
MTAPERGTATLSPELARRVGQVARTLVAAGRTWSLYPSEHPAVRTAVERLAVAIRDAAAGQALSFSVSPDALLIEGVPVTTRESPTTEAAAWLHNRDILQLSFLADVPPASLQALLTLLAEDCEAVRAAGGPAKLWADRGHPAVAVEQIDYAKVLQDRDVERPARRKDDLWRALVRAVLDRRTALDEAMQQRLLEIAGDVGAIGELAHDVMTPHHSADGSPMVTMQAAAVLAAFRHLSGIVEVMTPERRTEVMDNLAASTASIDPRIVIEMLRTREDNAASGVRESLAGAFDDGKVANLLATTLAIEGQASNRLAEVFAMIAPEKPRKRRVLTLTREILGDTAFGRTDQFTAVWTSMEELLLTYNERPFVGVEYKVGLDVVGSRAEEMAKAVAPELASLIDTLDQENVRKLSVLLLIDLLRIEKDRQRAPEVARDASALAEDLLLSGEFGMALDVVAALAGEAAKPAAVTQSGSRAALEALAGTPAFRETAELFGEMDDQAAGQFAAICRHVGPAAAEALRDLLRSETETGGMRRARPVIRELGARAVSRLAPLVSSDQWFVQRNAAELLGELAAAEAVPLLQPLLRGGDARVLRAAVRALANIDDPSAARALHTVLRAATGDQRVAVVSALVDEKDPRAVPLLARILGDSDPVGADHAIVLETLDAIGRMGGEQAIPQVSAVMRRRGWFARRRLRALKQTSVSALRRIGTPAAQRALTEAAADGDRLLKKLARAALSGASAHG